MADGDVIEQLKVQKLYNLCLAKIADRFEVLKVDFSRLPGHLIFDICNVLLINRNFCVLNFSICHFEIFDKLLRLADVRNRLHSIFQALEEHGTKLGQKLCARFCEKVSAELEAGATFSTKLALIQSGLRLGIFLGDAAWFGRAETVFSACLEVSETLPSSPVQYKLQLQIYNLLLRVQAMFSDLQRSARTYQTLQKLLKEMKEKTNETLNLAAIYTNFAQYHFICNDFKSSYEFSMAALRELNESLPPKIRLDALRQASKSLVVRRIFKPASILITQALDLAMTEFGPNHPKYADTQVDYGYFLLNCDCIERSVTAYEAAYKLRKSIFLKNNMQVSFALEDLSYALYVFEYSSGRFDRALELAEEAIAITQELLPPDHILLTSPLRVKALILEEISIDQNPNMTDTEMLREAEKLHLFALNRSVEHFGEMNVQTAKHYGNLGRLYQSMKKFDKAEKMQIKAIHIKEAILGPEDYEVGLSLGHLASLYNYHMNRHEEALVLYHRSINISLKLFGPEYSGLEYDYRGLIHVYEKFADRASASEFQHILINWRMQRERLLDAPKHHIAPIPPLPIKEVVESVLDLVETSSKSPAK